MRSSAAAGAPTAPATVASSLKARRLQRQAGVYAVVAMQFRFPVSVGEVRQEFGGIARRRLELRLRERDDIAADLTAILQHGPRQWVELSADAQKTAERHQGVNDLARLLVDHNIVD